MSVTAKDLDATIHNGSKYTLQDKTHSAVTYLTLGNINKVSEAVNIPRTTLQGWSKTEWWEELVNQVRLEKKDEFDAGFTRIIDKSINLIEKQLDTGEVKAMDAAKIMGISFDKRQILNNAPTSITNNVSSEELANLKAQFEQLSGKTIPGERIE